VPLALGNWREGRRGVWVSPLDRTMLTDRPNQTGTFNLSKGYELKRQPKWEKSYDKIKSELLTLACRGDFRIVASNLAESHNISRTVLKDVQLRLIEDGIVRMKGRSWLLNRFDFQVISEHYSVRKVLEPHALRTGFANIDFDEAGRCLERLEDAAKRREELSSAQLERMEQDLHVDTLSKCGNTFLMEILRRSRLVHVFNSYYYPKFNPDTLFVQEHINVFTSILRRDVAKAEVALMHHLDASEQHTHARVRSVILGTEISDQRYARLVN